MPLPAQGTGYAILNREMIPVVSLLGPTDTAATAPKIIGGGIREQIMLADPSTGEPLDFKPLIDVLAGGGEFATLSSSQVLAGGGVLATTARTAVQLAGVPSGVDLAAEGTILVKGPDGQVYYVLPDGTGYCAVGELGGTVSPEQVGATGNNVVDDSAYMTLACSGLWQKVKLRPRANYLCGDVKIANGVMIDGSGGRDYTGIHSYMLPRLTRKVGCNAVLNINNQADANFGRAITLIGVVIDGVDNTCNGLSAGSVRLNAVRCYVTNCVNGLGGAAAGGSAYTRVADIENCIFTNNTVGIRDFIDSRIYSECANNGVNVKLTSGANHNTFRGRYEWATTGENFRIDAAGAGAPVSRIKLLACELDRGTTSGIYLNNAEHIDIISCTHDRAGAGNTGVLGTRAQIHIENCTGITIANPTAIHGHDDGGAGVDTPPYFIECNGIVDTLVITGGDVSLGYITQAIHYNSGLNTTQMPGHKITGVGGMADYNNSELRWKDSGRTFFGPSAHTGVLSATTGTATVTGLRVPGPAANDARGYTMKIWTRDASSSLRNLSSEIPFEVRKDGGTATIVMAAFGGKEMGVRGAIGASSTTASGTGQAGGTTTILRLNAGASSTDDAYLGMSFSCSSGTNSGYANGVCIGYNGTTKDAHLHKPAAAAFDATSVFAGKYGSQIQISTSNVVQAADSSVTFDVTFNNISADQQDIWAEISQ